MFKKLITWYNNNLALNTGIAAGLFALQLVHLAWLSLNVLLPKLGGPQLFNLTGVWETIVVLVDYTEVPAIIAVSLVYINDMRHGFKWRPFLFLLFINSQWLHIFWITDQFVLESFGGIVRAGMPGWLAWIALLIDYLELPVIYDTFRKFFLALKNKEKITKEVFEG